MAVEDKPTSWYYNVTRGELTTSEGDVIRNPKNFPSATLGQRKRINLQLFESGTTKYSGIGSTANFEILADSDYKQAPPLLPLYGDGIGAWKLSDNGTYEYYYVAEDVSKNPQTVTFDGTEVPEETLGSLTQGSYGYGDNDNLGYNTLYVRLNDDSDPDTKADGWVAQQPPTEEKTQSWLVIDPDTIQEDGTWYDEGTGEWRNPKSENGEISFLLNARRTSFYERLGGSNEEQISFEVQLLDSNGYLVEAYTFPFFARRRRLAEGEELDIDYPQYTKSEAQSVFIKGDGTNKIVVSETEPSNPQTGEIWIDPSA